MVLQGIIIHDIEPTFLIFPVTNYDVTIKKFCFSGLLWLDVQPIHGLDL